MSCRRSHPPVPCRANPRANGRWWGRSTTGGTWDVGAGYGWAVSDDRPVEAVYRTAEQEAALALEHLRGALDNLHVSLGDMPPVWNTLVGVKLDPGQIDASGLSDRLDEIRQVVVEFRAQVDWLEGLVEEWPDYTPLKPID